jgi:hypothetical protein
VAKNYLERLAGAGLRSLADNGDLMARRAGARDSERHELRPAVARDDWYDPAAKGPRT